MCLPQGTVPPYLGRAPAGGLGSLAALGGHAGVAGADEHRGADVQGRALGGGVHHAVQSVEGRGERELPQALPPGLGSLGERHRDLGLGGCRALGLRGPVALGGLQELLSGAAGLQETTGDVLALQRPPLTQSSTALLPCPPWQHSCRQGSGDITGYP